MKPSSPSAKPIDPFKDKDKNTKNGPKAQKKKKNGKKNAKTQPANKVEQEKVKEPEKTTKAKENSEPKDERVRTVSGRIICKHVNKMCYFLNQPEGCRYYHPKCKSGVECSFHKDGRCRFYHKKAE